MCFKRKNKVEKKVEEKNANIKEKKSKSETKKDLSQKTEKNSAGIREEKNKKSIYRVVFSKEQNAWQIKKDGAKRIIDSKPTKEEALTRVKELSQSQDTKYIVHKKDGKFQKKSNVR